MTAPPDAAPARPERAVEELLAAGEPSLEDWIWLWEGDRRLPPRPETGWLAPLKRRLKRLVARWVGGAQLDLWERQRLFNLALSRRAAAVEKTLERLDRLEAALDALGRDLQSVQRELVAEVRGDRAGVDELGERVRRVEELEGTGFRDVMRHTDALFSRLELQLDRYRRRSRELWGRLEGLLAAADSGEAPALVRAAREQGYVELERRFRGEEVDIRSRLEPYLRFLEGRQRVLDLGCGRGEALEVMRERGIAARGVDASARMVAQCREKGLEAEEGDLFETLAGAAPESLGAVVSFHVIEHLPSDSLDRLVRLAWRALAPGGVLIFETPSPLSLVVAARNFWIDPTHRRPVHPESLELGFRLAGFDPVERIDLQPFGAGDRLPAVELGELPAYLRPLGERVNRLRDTLDGLLFGYQDYGLVGTKPGTAAASTRAPQPSG